MPGMDRPEVEWILLADRAECLGGKLYLMGGGWADINVLDFSQPVPFAVAVAILCPWSATNERFPFTLTIESDDGKAVIPPIQIETEASRPIGSTPGQSFRTMLAINGSLPFPAEGTYAAIATLGDFDTRRVAFRVLRATPLVPMQPR